jgi:hypothetical protein
VIKEGPVLQELVQEKDKASGPERWIKRCRPLEFPREFLDLLLTEPLIIFCKTPLHLRDFHPDNADQVIANHQLYLWF